MASVARRSRWRVGVGRDGSVPPLAALFLLIALCASLVAMPLSAGAAISPEERETEDLAIGPLDPDQDPEAILRARPFLIGPDRCPTFCPEREGTVVAEDEARDRLISFLERRGLSEAAIEDALERYDEPATVVIAPAPTLRAALLMLSDWEPYDAVLRAVLEGDNPIGQPFAAVAFLDLGIEGAVATLISTETGRHAILVDDDFAGEPPESLVNVLAHEALHDPWQNSQEEELIANILDNVLWAEVLLVEPDAARAGTLLTIFNNFALLALLNSTGRAGPGQLGISATPFDDVWIGDQLDEANAASIRDAIVGDGFYAELPRGGSPGQETYWALIDRFPTADDLGDEPRFDEAALSVIDQGVGRIIDPVEAVELAATLRLHVVEGVIELTSVELLPDDPLMALAARPFAATDAALVDPAAASDPPATLDDEETRDLLVILLRRQGTSLTERRELLARYDEPFLTDLIPHPSLRAAALLLAAHEPWNDALAAIQGEVEGVPGPIPVEFAELPVGTMVARGRAADGGDAYPLLVSEALVGEAPEVLASYLVEGLLLHERQRDGRTTRDQAILANLLGTLVYADFLVNDQGLATLGTAGTIGRNRDLFALLNSASWQNPNGELTNAALASPLGFLAAPTGVDDILPGFYADATSFAEYVTTQPRAADYSKRTRLAANQIVASVLRFVDLDPDALAATLSAGPTYGEASAALDARLGAFLSPEEALGLARVLRLGVGRA